MDLIIANNLCEEGAGFQTDTNVITIIDRDGKTENLSKMTKLKQRIKFSTERKCF